MFRLVTIVWMVGIVSVVSAAETPGVKVDWLDHAAPLVTTGVSFGVPWPRGSTQKGASLHLVDAKGQQLPLQTWPMAYWPDGSLKWTGHAISASAGVAGPFTIEPGEPAAAQTPIKITQGNDVTTIDTGVIKCQVSRSNLARIWRGDAMIAMNGKLICLREARAESNGVRTFREEPFDGLADSVTVEQAGPVRAVIKFTGKYQRFVGDRTWLPFVVRMYFFAGSDSIRIVHSFIFDGDPQTDFIKGLGIQFEVPMREATYNRHVRFAGETGIFAEPVQIISGRRPMGDLPERQIAGKRLPKLDETPRGRLVEQMAVWDSYKLNQLSADGYAIQKRTNDQSAWIQSAGGKRAIGTAFVGDVSGGIALGMKNFWQQHPTALEIAGASTDAAHLTLWLWSPDAPAMDLRHYDTKGHDLDASYEDYEKDFATPVGIARTNEVTIRAFSEVPSNEELLNFAKTVATPPHLVSPPEYYHSIPIFGRWSLPDRSHPTKAWIEDQLDKAIAFYQGQIEQRRWYGFWDFGDVMHSYDAQRHEWRYDIGGFAWANTELMPDLWLWYSFLRSGRGDVFRMAEAMTRHTQEVDSYHVGRFAGLGSRHNVRHWGDSAKELRIAQALLKRPYYYLTTDERTGDLISEVTDADERLVDVDPLRKVEPEKINYPTHARVGPDWFAMCTNWLAAWERTGDVKYRDRIIVGMKCMSAMPHKLFSGRSYGYDPKTKMLHHLHDEVDIPHLAALMGGPEAMMEITPLIDLPEWNEAWLNYCQYLQAPREEQRDAIGGTVITGQGPHFSKMTAWAAWKLNDDKLATRAWDQFLGRGRRDPFGSRKIDDANVQAPVDEIPFASTNNTAQWSLNAIELLELIGAKIPDRPPTTAPANASE